MKPGPVVGRAKEAITGETGGSEESRGFNVRLVWAPLPDLQCASCVTLAKSISSSVSGAKTGPSLTVVTGTK